MSRGCWLRAWRWGVGVGFLTTLLSAQAEVLELTQAQICAGAEAACTAQDTPLPYFWDAAFPGRAGLVEIVVPFTPAASVRGPQAVYLPRVGNGYEIALNGVLLENSQEWDTPNGVDFAKQPRLITLSNVVLGARNELRIRLRADVGRRAGLARPLIGPRDELMVRFQRDHRWRVLGSAVAAALSASVAILALALWASQRRQMPVAGAELRRDPAYLYAAVALTGWAFFLADPLVEAPLMGWPWWGMVLAAAFAAGVCAMTLFCQHIAGLDTRRSNWLMGALALSGVCGAALGWWWSVTVVWTLWISGVAVFYTVYGFYFAWVCWRDPSAGKMLLSVAVLLNVLGGLWDWFGVVHDGDLYGDYASGRYLPMLYGLSLGYIMVARFRDASQRADTLAANMAAQVTAKTEELRNTYQRMEQLVRAQARAAERSRILRDMHDGVGSHISSAIRQLQSGKANHATVLLTLRDALDQLKLSIDAMNTPPGDVTALLANMRYRLEPRFAASDIALQWDVDMIEPLPQLDSDAMRQLQFMLFEALSNALQHANASVIHIRASHTPEGVQVSIADNGGGFEVASPPRNRLSSMQARAAAIGARVAVQSAPGRTVVEIAIANEGRANAAA